MYFVFYFFVLHYHLIRIKAYIVLIYFFDFSICIKIIQYSQDHLHIFFCYWQSLFFHGPAGNAGISCGCPALHSSVFSFFPFKSLLPQFLCSIHYSMHRAQKLQHSCSLRKKEYLYGCAIPIDSIQSIFALSPNSITNCP